MRSLRLFTFLLEHSRATLVLLLVAGVGAGLFSAALLALITRLLTHRESASWLLFGVFVALLLGKVVATVSAQLLLARFSHGTILELSLRLARKILDAPLRVLEQRGGGKILATLTDDVSAVTWAVQCVPQLAMNAAIVLGCATYLAWLSWPMFLSLALVIVLGALIYKVQHDRAFRLIDAARSHRSTLFTHFRSLTLGVKELMMHRARREQFVDAEIGAAAEAYRSSNLAATRHYALADAWVQLLYHALVALVLFCLPLLMQPSVEALTGYVFALLYLMVPLWSIIGAVPAVARGRVALAEIEELGVSIDGAAGASPSRAAAQVGDTGRIELRQAVFRYESSAGSSPPFCLGPLDLCIEPGELLFVVGGNGSGKTTFVKLLTGLYAPTAGELLLDGVAITDANRAAYRERFSVVFSDFHLFDKLLGLGGIDLDEIGRGYISRLQLAHKVDLSEGRYSTTDLSQGQRKRLALVTAYLENRAVYVFDEWAADQDPQYKQIFYSQLLPDLRGRGKAVIVITHDDRFFHLGDHVLELEDGRVVASQRRPADG